MENSPPTHTKMFNLLKQRKTIFVTCLSSFSLLGSWGGRVGTLSCVY